MRDAEVGAGLLTEPDQSLTWRIGTPMKRNFLIGDMLAEIRRRNLSDRSAAAYPFPVFLPCDPGAFAGNVLLGSTDSAPKTY
jgi:hypothetical protein